MNRTEYTRLANKYLDTVFRVAVNSCDSGADAEDITQEVFLKLLSRNETFENDDYARKWLIRVTINAAHDLWRHKRRYSLIPLEEIAATQTFEQNFSSEDHSILYAALQSLPLKDRQVIHLFYYEGYCTREIAEILGTREGAVRTRLLRARRKLKDLLQEDF